MSEYQFLQNAVLDTIVPQASNLNIEELLGSIQENSSDLSTCLSNVPQRELLFFDEQITLFMVLRLSGFTKDTLEACISNLSVHLEVHAIDDGNSDEQSEEECNAKDLIYSHTVGDKDDPLVIVDESIGDGKSENNAYVIWKSEAFLYRPRVRLRHPSVVFHASADFGPQGSDPTTSDQYLPPLTPASTNIFQPLIAAGEDLDPYLPSSRILRLVPSTQPKGSIYNVQQKSYNPIRIIPAASAKIRYARSATISKKLSTTASLEFEATPFTCYDVLLEEAELSLANGTVEPLGQAIGFSPPILCPARDDISLVYRLVSAEIADTTTPVTSTLDISLKVVVAVSEDCRPKISMCWSTNVDFHQPTNQSLGGLNNMLRRSIVSQSSDSAQELSTPQVASVVSPESKGVKISFYGPSSVEVGRPFDWDIFVVNTSDRSRKFGIVAVPFRRRADTRAHVPRPSSTSSIRVADTVAEAAVDENIVYAMQQNAAPHETDLICLSTDTKIGPLLPGTCHSTRLRLLPLAPGLLHLEVVKLVDLGANETMEIRDLPDIVAYPAADRRGRS